MTFDPYSEDPARWAEDFKEYIVPTNLFENEGDLIQWIHLHSDECSYLERVRKSCLENGWHECVAAVLTHESCK